MLKEHHIRLTRTELIKLASEVTLIKKKFKDGKEIGTETYRGKQYKVYKPVHAGDVFLL
jgi:hypothetical protein